jgi:hypothetical protein
MNCRQPARYLLVLAACAGAAAFAAAPATAQRVKSPYGRAARSDSARTVYALNFGVDQLQVQSTASGNLIRFRYRVVDARRAAAIADKKSTPYLYGRRSRALLQVPTMDFVGELRQAQTVENGKDYWMVFSNKGNHVRIGDRVDVLVGPVRIEGLVVE